MFRRGLSLSFASALVLVAGCSAAVDDGSSQSDEALAGLSKSDNTFLMNVLADAGVPEVAPAAHVLGVGASRSANVHVQVSSGGFVPHIVQSGDVSATDGTVYGDVDASDVTRLGKVLVRGGASWVHGTPRCCDIPTVDTLDAFVSCHTVVAPGSPVRCTITPAAVPAQTDDAFMYDLLTNAGVTPDTTKPVPGAGTKYSAEVRLTVGGIAGVRLGDVLWGNQQAASIDAGELARVQSILEANGAAWGAVGPVTADEQSTLEALVTCSESVTAQPKASCTFEPMNIRPL